MTPLDALCDSPFHELPDPVRARVLNRLADTELFVALAEEPVEDRIRLHLFDLPGGRMAVAADAEDRLAGFFGGSVAYAALPGRVLAGMLAGETVGLMVNPGMVSEMMLPSGVLGWLSQALSSTPSEGEAGPAQLSAPTAEMVTALAEPLATRLEDMAGLVDEAALVAARWPDGTDAHLVVLSGVAEDIRPRVAKAIAELLAFLPVMDEICDVAFDLPVPDGALIFRPEKVQEAPAPAGAPRAPGKDPARPPILRF
ncbi:MAG: hypothetical protein ACK5II_07790 [Paracoccus sp. (in: a-proteobacteria)]